MRYIHSEETLNVPEGGKSNSEIPREMRSQQPFREVLATSTTGGAEEKKKC